MLSVKGHESLLSIICRKNTSDNFYIDGQEGEPDIIDVLKENAYLFA